MDDPDRVASPRTLLYVGLVVFVLAWILGPEALRDLVPLWLVFCLALGLELAFFAGAFRSRPAPSPDRGPQPRDRERFGYPPGEDEEGDEPDDVVLDAPPSRRWRRLLTGVALIGTLAGAAWLVESRTGWESLDGPVRAEATSVFSDEASRIAGKPVAIRCDEAGDYVGVVQHTDGAATVGGELAFLTPAICHDLYRLAFRDEVRSSRTARALAVLAHEAWHLRGEADEGVTECYAVQSGVGLGVRLGLSEERARALMRLALRENALRSGASFEYRVPPECRDAGRLDLAQDDPRFP